MTDCTTVQVVSGDGDGNGNGTNGDGDGSGDGRTAERLTIAGAAFLAWRALTRGGE